MSQINNIKDSHGDINDMILKICQRALFEVLILGEWGQQLNFFFGFELFTSLVKAKENEILSQ